MSAYNNPANNYSGLLIKDITSNDLLLGFRYKLQHEAPLYAVK